MTSSEAALIVVGSGPAGVGAAEAFRRHDDETPVRILTADPAPPYARLVTEQILAAIAPLSKDIATSVA